VIEQVKSTLDIASILTVSATLMSWLPEIAAGLTAIWMLIRIGEWLHKKLKDPFKF